MTWRVLATITIAAPLLLAYAAASLDVRVDDQGSVALPAATVPYSDLASDEARQDLVAFAHNLLLRKAAIPAGADIATIREVTDRLYIIPARDALLAHHPVTITKVRIGGVPGEMIESARGTAPDRKKKILINLHGGSFLLGAPYVGQLESIPLAALGRYTIFSVDYRMAPEHRFPAASEDVAKVYSALLETHEPRDIGIYGCSAGAMLTAQSLAWFNAHGLPQPAAAIMAGGGGVIDRRGDAAYMAAGLGGYALAPFPAEPEKLQYMEGSDTASALASPALHQEVLRHFPPTMMLSGTRDALLSVVIYTHQRIVAAGAESELHVFEGQRHCSIYWDLPESRDAWRAMIAFFDRHLLQGAQR